jgi:hypothetical protein
MGPTPDVPVPEIFKNRRLRSGKWIKEEEAYADALIDQFESGVAPNCPNGATLRSYLSRMLHCAPMRISKKYAGKGIGKMVFASRIGGLSSSKNADGELRRRAAQVKEKEDKFYKAVHRAHGFMNVRWACDSLQIVAPCCHAVSSSGTHPICFVFFLNRLRTASSLVRLHQRLS